jgi:membrane protein
VAGVLWQSIGFMFATFMAGSTQYAAIYSGLAIVILFMIWVYIAWLILLVGASIAFYDQYPEYLGSTTRDLRLSNRQRERLALLLAARVAATHYSKDPSCTAEGLSHALAMPLTNVRNVLRILEQAEVLVHTADQPPHYVPARAPEEVLVQDLLAFVRRYGEDEVTARQPRSTPAIDALELRLVEAQDSALAQLSLRDLAISSIDTGKPDKPAG